MTALTLVRHDRADRYRSQPAAPYTAGPALPRLLDPSHRIAAAPQPAVVPALRAGPRQDGEIVWRPAAGTAAILAVKIAMLWATFQPV